MSYFVTLPFSTSVRKRFRYLRSFDEMELRKISFYYWSFYLLAYDSESPSMSLSKSIEV